MSLKKAVLLLLFILLGFLGYTQSENVVTQVDWTIENKDEWGSFYWAVTREAKPNPEGKYFYYVYFYSNSIFNSKSDGIHYDKASTYIRDIDITMFEYGLSGSGEEYVLYNTFKLEIPYFTCDYSYDKKQYVAYFYSYFPYNNFDITFEKASAFDYSIYKK
jgi:hypothetical protein